MKYIIITRTLQSDFEWEKDAENIATIFMDLLKIKFPKNSLYYQKAFITYFARYIADSSSKATDSKEKLHSKIADLIEEIEMTGYEESKLALGSEAEFFKFNYKEQDYDLILSLLDTTTKEYYRTVKPEVIDKVEFLKQDYGENNLCFVNSAHFYAHLLDTFYDHNCQSISSKYDDSQEILEEVKQNKDIVANNYEVIYA